MAGRDTGFANKGLVWLNVILAISQISSYATGYDGSMMSELPARKPPTFVTDSD
jgi:hypothetical protein